jgi:hypothetical protein
VRDELAELEQQPTYTDTPAATRVKADLGKRLAAWHDLLQRNVPLARQALRKLLDGPIKFVPEEDGGYRLVGRTVIGSLFDDAAFPPTHAKMASPRRTAAKPAIKFVRKVYLKGFRRRIIGLPASVD